MIKNCARCGEQFDARGSAKYCSACRVEQHREYKRRYRAKHREQHREYKRRYRAKHRYDVEYQNRQREYYRRYRAGLKLAVLKGGAK